MQNTIQWFPGRVKANLTAHRFTIVKRFRFFGCLSFFTKDLARLHCSVVNALTTFCRRYHSFVSFIGRHMTYLTYFLF